MKSRMWRCTTMLMLSAALTAPAQLTAQNEERNDSQSSYFVIKLASLGGTASGASSINTIGWVTGFSNLSGDQVQHAAFWAYGLKLDLRTLGGPNSGVEWPVHNDRGKVVGIAETDKLDPWGEIWSCGYFFPTFTHHTCLGFVWENGVMTPLPTLGGNNGYAAGMNNRSQIVGWAENTVHDPTCTLPQVLQFEAVIWGPAPATRIQPPRQSITGAKQSAFRVSARMLSAD